MVREPGGGGILDGTRTGCPPPPDSRRLDGRRQASASGRPDARTPTYRSFSPMTTGPETSYRVRGGNQLHGTVFVQGAKNAALKMIAASLLAAKGRTVLRNVPAIEDVRRAVELAQAVGAVVK